MREEGLLAPVQWQVESQPSAISCHKLHILTHFRHLCVVIRPFRGRQNLYMVVPSVVRTFGSKRLSFLWLPLQTLTAPVRKFYSWLQQSILTKQLLFRKSWVFL
jgi:hypothetical protein